MVSRPGSRRMRSTAPRIDRCRAMSSHNSAWTSITSWSGGDAVCRRIAISRAELPAHASRLRSVGETETLRSSAMNPSFHAACRYAESSCALGVDLLLTSRSNQASCSGSNHGSVDASTRRRVRGDDELKRYDTIVKHGSDIPPTRLSIDRCHRGCRWLSTSSKSMTTCPGRLVTTQLRRDPVLAPGPGQHVGERRRFAVCRTTRERSVLGRRSPSGWMECPARRQPTGAWVIRARSRGLGPVPWGQRS